jgi:hypothetical protein
LASLVADTLVADTLVAPGSLTAAFLLLLLIRDFFSIAGSL